MAKKVLQTDDTPNILIRKIAGDLNIKGWERPAIALKSSLDNEFIIEESPERITIESPHDCIIYIPHKAQLEAQLIEGDARFKSLDGTILVGEVRGDLILRDSTLTQIGFVRGDFSAKRIHSNLVIDTIDGDASIDDINGLVAIDTTRGDLLLRRVSGGITVSAAGDIDAAFAPVPWQAYELNAGGDLFCRIPADTNADIDITSKSGVIHLQTSQNPHTLTENSTRFTIGEGGTSIRLEAGGEITLIDRISGRDGTSAKNGDLISEINDMTENIIERVAGQIGSGFDTLENDLDSHISRNPAGAESGALPERETEEFRLQIERARANAEKQAKAAAKRAQRKLQKRLEAARKKALRKAKTSAARKARKKRRKTGVGIWKIGANPLPDDSEPVSDEERMMVLQMLQENTISLEQAEKLLAALEGEANEA